MPDPRPYDFRLNPGAQFSACQIGREQEPALIVDGVMRDPGQLVDYAAEEGVFEAGPNLGLYPGVRAAAPLDYVETLVRAADPMIRQAFGIGEAALAKAECSFSMVTTPPTALEPLQRIPHIDTTYPLQFALLHYLCTDDHGGTAFYRQRLTGFEVISAERQADYLSAREKEFAESEVEPEGYITSSTATYEQTHAFNARFDRLLIYRSCVLHSGIIGPGGWNSADPRTGRLTANIFLSYRA